MKVLLIGSGGREHALAWKIAQSPRLTKLYAAPGNPGIAEEAAIVDLHTENHEDVVDFCRTHAIDFVVVGPEAPLVAGLGDVLRAADIPTFGPSPQRPNSKAPRVSPRTSARDTGSRPAPIDALPMPSPPRPISAKRAHRSSSRPTGLPPARA